VTRLEPTQPTAPPRAVRPRCVICKRFARLPIGETRCAACRGELPLDFGGGGR
jgi:hypothetical protein